MPTADRGIVIRSGDGDASSAAFDARRPILAGPGARCQSLGDRSCDVGRRRAPVPSI